MSEMKLNDEQLFGVAGAGANGDYWWENGILVYHIVYGDTLSEIALRFGTSVQQLMYLNPQIRNPNFIQADTNIRIR